MKNKLLTALFGVSVVLLIITASIGIPIYCRFFYYMLINPLELPKHTGYSFIEIKAAYDEVLNYLTLPWSKFSTGVFACSNDGAAHFYDCKKLFNLNASVLIASALIVATLLILHKKNIITLIKIKGYGVSFYSAVTVLSLFVVIALLVSIDFNTAFVIFHKIFFPGKDNWIFDPDVDEIITALPQEFFLLCAVLIVVAIIIISLAIIIYQIRKKKSKPD